MVENPPANAGDAGTIPGSGRAPGEGNGNPLTPVFLPGESYGQRSLEGYSPGDRKELEVTDATVFYLRRSLRYRQGGTT